MNDLHERLRQIERNPSPDLWDAITSRVVGSVPRTATQPGWRRVAIIAASLAIGLAAVAWVVIATRPTTSPPVAVDQPFAWPNNSCGLVTNSEVEAATHSKVTQSGLLTDNQLIFPEGPNPCQYETDDEHTSLTVFVSPDDIEEFNRVRDRDPVNVAMLPAGLGDEAFSTGGASLWVRVGSGYFVITSQHGAGKEGALSELEALARLALGSRDATLLVSSSGPSGDEALLTGTLTVESGCIAVAGGPGSSVYVVWPSGYSLADEGGETWLVDDSGNQVARIGDEVQMGGGITNFAHAEPSVPGGIPSSCEVGGPDAYWFAGTPDLVGPSPPASEVEATRMPGIDAYKVCRVLSLPGDFGDAGDEVVVFEEERVLTAGCVGSEGFQHVAVLRDGHVTALSRRITDVFDEDAWRVWPYATPDLNGDGVDEIAIALRHEPGNATRVWFLVLSPDGSGLEGIYGYQGAAAFSYLIGTGTDPLPYLLPPSTYGVFCDGAGDARRIVTWRVATDDPTRVAEKRWRLVSSNVEVVSATNGHVGEGSGYPDDGSQELCGSPVSERTVYPGQAPT